MELSQLFTRGSKLSDVPPDFKGMPLAEWQSKQITAMANSKEAEAFWNKFLVNGEPKLAGKRLWNKRDDYGMRGTMA